MKKSVRKVDVHKRHLFEEYRDFPGLAPTIDRLEKKALAIKKRLRGRRLWMLNSTAVGGGVAEMMPALISLMNQLKLPVSWLVFSVSDPAFFHFTKKMHHLLHGRSPNGYVITDEEKRKYLDVSSTIAQDLKSVVGKRDLIVVHDPQPLGAGTILSKSCPSLKLLWRCHVGTEFRNLYSQEVWSYLRQFFKPYAETFFTHPDYIPSFLKKKSSLLSPSVDPLSNKNEVLSTEELVEIFKMAGLYGTKMRGFKKPVKRLLANGSKVLPQELNPFSNPMVLQVSRWDHLKGFIPLMEGFLFMKERLRSTHFKGLTEITQKMLNETILILAGPEEGGKIADDPEPKAVLQEIINYYRELPVKHQKDIYILLLPMDSRQENALICNALQRSAEIIVQNSIREGFGLTVTEALWKETPVLATGVGGLRQQVKDKETGLLIRNPMNSREVGQKLLYLLTHKRERMTMARRGWIRTIENFLAPVHVLRYLEIFERHL